MKIVLMQEHPRLTNLYTLRKRKSFLLLNVFVILLFSSCYSTKRYQYFQDLTDSTSGSIPVKDYNFSLKFLPLDEININVISAIPALAAPFNITNTTSISNFSGNAAIAAPGTTASIVNPINNSFRVNADGDIDYPFIGILHVQDKTVRQLKDTLTQILRSRFIKDATVEVRLANPTITVMGEVLKPGRISFASEKTSIIDAVIASGDFTKFSNRKDVILLREKDGKKEIHHINMQQTDIFKSEYYYLRQNDIVFVQATKDKGFLNDPYSSSIVKYVYMIAALISFYYIFKK